MHEGDLGVKTPMPVPCSQGFFPGAGAQDLYFSEALRVILVAAGVENQDLIPPSQITDEEY